MHTEKYQIEIINVLKKGTIPSHINSWNESKYDWVYKEENEKLFRICRVTGRFEEVEKIPLKSENEFDLIYKKFHQKRLTKVNLSELQSYDNRKIGYGILINVNELNNEEPYDDAYGLGLESEMIYQDRNKNIAFFGIYIETGAPILEFDKDKVILNQEDEKELKEKLLKMGMLKEDIEYIGLHYYIL